MKELSVIHCHENLALKLTRLYYSERRQSSRYGMEVTVLYEDPVSYSGLQGVTDDIATILARHYPCDT